MSARGGDLLAWLDHAITARENAARATTGRQPYDEWDAVGAGTDSDTRRSQWRVVGIATMNPTPAAYDLAQHIALNDPESVMRRCAADRALVETFASVLKNGNKAEKALAAFAIRQVAIGYGWSETIPGLKEALDRAYDRYRSGGPRAEYTAARDAYEQARANGAEGER